MADDKNKKDDPDLAPPAPLEKKPPRSEFAAHMIAKYGSAENAIAELGAENVSYRERHNKDTEQITRLQDRVNNGTKVPEGGKILSKDEAAAFDAYTALGKPEEVKKKIEDGEAAKTSLTEKEAKEHIASVAEIAGYNPTVLADLAKDKKFTLSLVDQKVDGELVKVPMVTPEGSKDAVELSVFIDKNLSAYKASLEATEVDEDSEEIVPALRQRSSEGQGSRKQKGGASKSAVVNYHQQTYAGPKGSTRQEEKK